MILALTWRNPVSLHAIDVHLRIEDNAAFCALHTGNGWQWLRVMPLHCDKAWSLNEHLDIAAWCIARLADPSTARNEPELLRHAIDAGIERINGKTPEQWLRARQRDKAHHVPFIAW